MIMTTEAVESDTNETIVPAEATRNFLDQISTSASHIRSESSAQRETRENRLNDADKVGFNEARYRLVMDALRAEIWSQPAVRNNKAILQDAQERGGDLQPDVYKNREHKFITAAWEDTRVEEVRAGQTLEEIRIGMKEDRPEGEGESVEYKVSPENADIAVLALAAASEQMRESRTGFGIVVDLRDRAWVGEASKRQPNIIVVAQAENQDQVTQMVKEIFGAAKVQAL